LGKGQRYRLANEEGVFRAVLERTSITIYPCEKRPLQGLLAN